MTLTFMPHQRTVVGALAWCRRWARSVLFSLAAASIAGLAWAGSAADFGQRIIRADSEPYNWLSHGRTYGESRHSPLADINEGNVARLGLVWSHDLDVNRGQESTPLVVDGKMYTTSAWSKVQAFDAVTGRLLWQFDPKVPGPAAAKGCCDVVNRGAAYWDGRVYVGTLDGRLVALNANTGKPVWSTLTVDPTQHYTITGAPRIVKGLVIIGNGGAEFGVRGYVSAYDAKTGKLVWRFYTVPGEPGKPDHAASDEVLARLAAPTWRGEWWKRSGGMGGGTVWDSMAYDPELDLLYVGVGNAAYWNQSLRSPGGGDNLFVASILALRPSTGEYVWHYQQTPGDMWDYTSTQHMILTDLAVAGQTRKVLLQAPKNGFFYVIDRTNGKLISAEPYTPLNWAKYVDKETGRPVFNPQADYAKTGQPFVGMPGPQGAHNWQPMAFNPQTRLVYIPAIEMGFVYATDAEFKVNKKAENLGVSFTPNLLPDDPQTKADIIKTIKGHLLAWDPVKGKEVWRVPHTGSWNGGVLSTAGNLVVQGDGDGFLSIFNAETGAKLWSFDAQSGILAAPITWAANGRQYLTVLAGWGGSWGMWSGEAGWGPNGVRLNKSRVLTFALDGRATLPARQPVQRSDFRPPDRLGDADQIKVGEVAYNRICVFCHGGGGVSSGVTPELRRTPLLASPNGWRAVVAEGVLAGKGMIGFKDVLSAPEVEAIRAYLIDRAHRQLETDQRKETGVAPVSR